MYIYVLFSSVSLPASDQPRCSPDSLQMHDGNLGSLEGHAAPFVRLLPGKAAAVLMGTNRYVWEEDPCQEYAASLIFRQVLF